MRTQQQAALQTMLKLLNGHCVEQALFVVANLGIADLLRTGPKTSHELADCVGVDRQALHRVLKMLSSMDVFGETDGKFDLTDLGSTLRSDVQNSVRDRAMFYGAPEMWKTWGELMHSVRTGRAAFEYAHDGADFYFFLSQHPHVGAPFNRYMSKTSEQHIPALLQTYDFSEFRCIADVGGGHGRTLAAILRTTPQLSGVLFDMPGVVEGATALDEMGEQRVSRISGDMSESVPDGCDAYLLKWVLMDRSDDEVIGVLENCRRAMAEGGKVIVVEMLLPEGKLPTMPALLDIQMMLLSGRARLRTENEFRHLFASAGLAVIRCLGTQSPNSIIEGQRLA